MQLKIKRLSDSASIPMYAHPTDSGLDLVYSGTEDIMISPLKHEIIPTGISIELPPNTEGQVRSRSGLAAKHGICVLNSPGTIDEGYTGEIKVILYNSSSVSYWVYPGAKIAQLVICPVIRCKVTEVSDHQESDRGVQGLGSTGY